MKLFLMLAMVLSTVVPATGMPPVMIDRVPPGAYGDFYVTERTETELHVTFEGDVTPDDADDLRRLMEDFSCLHVFITIESGGGSAWGGVDLYLEAENHDNLTTIAGTEFGAWSAAALFWLGGPESVCPLGGIVGFHAAYCDWRNPPGCDTTDIHTVFYLILEHELGTQMAHDLMVEILTNQMRHGVSYWVGIHTFPDGTMGWAEWSTIGWGYVPIPWDMNN